MPHISASKQHTQMLKSFPKKALSKCIHPVKITQVQSTCLKYCLIQKPSTNPMYSQIYRKVPNEPTEAIFCPM